MSYTTRWFPGTISSDRPESFLWEGLKFYLANLRPRHFLKVQRTVGKVRADYDASRRSILEKLESADWETYIYGPDGDEDFTLLGDRIVWSSLREARSQVLDRIVNAVNRYCTSGTTVVEFGSGDGRNLIYLKKHFPEINFIGLELSPVSVQLSRAAAEKFGVKVSFYECDICDGLPDLPPRDEISLAYSCFALEMIPRNVQRAIENMLSSSSGAVCFFEPVSELWPWGPRGVTSRLRVAYLNRLQGFMPALKSALRGSSWSVHLAQRMRVSHNPINEGCEIHLNESAARDRKSTVQTDTQPQMVD